MAGNASLFDWPHRRYNPLTGDWLLVSPHRPRRPWQGQTEAASAESRPAYDPGCYLCPGNERAGGARNPPYVGTYVFTNDFQAVLPEAPAEAAMPRSHLLRAGPVLGTCRVICFSERHDWTLPDMPVEAIRGVVDVWAEQVRELGARYRWVQVFENKGALMGCSIPHPHGQVWATDTLPNEPRKEDLRQREYLLEHGEPRLLAYLREELYAEERLVAHDDHWAALVPFWGVWPFETMLVPCRPVERLTDLTETERDALAAMLKDLLSRYDRLFNISFPYTMGWHGAPAGGTGTAPHWQLHAHIYPPLLRSATVRKFMVGYEMLAEPQRDITPEQAAERLRAV